MKAIEISRQNQIQAQIVQNNPKLQYHFYYANGNVPNTIYKENDPTVAPELDLEVFNDSPPDITLTAPQSNDYEGELKKGNYHFSLKFPRGLLVDVAQSSLKTSGWEVAYDANTADNYEVIYFLKKTEQTLAENEGVTLTLLQFCARAEYQNDTVDVYLVHGPLLEGNGLTVGDPVSNTIKTMDRKSKSDIPLHVGFISSNTILNDGKTSNELTLRITNTNSPNSIKPNLSFTSESKLIVSFETGDADDKPYALAEEEKVKAIGITVTDTSNWSVQKNSNSMEWTISPKGNRELEHGKYIELRLTNIQTNHPTGNANLYLRYEGIPDYRDGQFEVPIEKTPLLFRNKNVGIGIDNPAAKLHIVSHDRGYDDTLILGKLGSTPHLKLGYDCQDKYSKIESKNCPLTINPLSGQNVGIKTTDPKAELHVNGRIWDKTGYVVPVGTIVAFAGSTAPEGWLLCDGSSFTSSQYPELYKVLSNHYGGSGRLPNLQGRVPVGMSTDNEFKSLGKTGGEKEHALTVEEMPSHDHDVCDRGHSHKVSGGDNTVGNQGKVYTPIPSSYKSSSQYIYTSSSTTTGISIETKGGKRETRGGETKPHNNLQPYLVINYIIKY